MDHAVELLFRASHDPSEVFTVLSTRYTVLAEPITSERWTCLDTADWRLHRAGMTLRDWRRGRAGELVLTAADGELTTAPARVAAWPRRIDRVPPSAVRDRVAPTVGVRALLPMAAVDSRSTRLRLLDDVDKTRVRVQVDQQRLVDGTHAPLPLRVVVTPLRGYERDARRCAKLLVESMGAFDGQPDAVAAALVAAGRRPAADLSRAATPVTFAPDAPAAHSIAAVLLAHVYDIDANLSGVAADLDPEFLHEFHNAVRAIHSILTLTGDALAGAQVADVTAEFAWLEAVTTPVRDLDVLLLELHGHGQLDLAGLEPLDPLRRHVSRQRTRALRILRDALTSARMTALGAGLRALLERVAASDATTPATAVTVADRAVKAYATIGAAAGPLSADAPTGAVAALLTECAQLVDLLDSFAAGFDPPARLAVRNELRKLEDRLADAARADVQLRHLSEAAASLSASGAPVEAVLAIGALHDRIRRADVDARPELEEQVARVCGRRTSSQVESLALQLPETLRQSSL